MFGRIIVVLYHCKGEIHHHSAVSGEMICSRDAMSPPSAPHYHPDASSSHSISPSCVQGILPTYPVVALLRTQRLQEGWHELSWDGQQERPGVHNAVTALAAPAGGRQPDGESGESSTKGIRKGSLPPSPPPSRSAALTPRSRSSSTIPGPQEPIKSPQSTAGGQPLRG